MVQANDLRVNNLLFEQDNICKVFKIYKDKFSVWTLNGRRNGTLCEPILITSDILEKCGFELDGNFYLKNYPLYVIRQSDGTELISIIKELSCSNIKYLHQLQNLYYALTGTELEIQL